MVFNWSAGWDNKSLSFLMGLCLNICFVHKYRKKEFPFFGHCVLNKYLFWTKWPKKGNSFFRSFCPKQIFEFLGCFVQIHVRFSAQKCASRDHFQFLVWVLKHPFSYVIFWDGKTLKIMSSFFLHCPLVRFNNQLFVFAKMTEKGKFFFSVILPQTNICVPTPKYLFMTLSRKKESF